MASKIAINAVKEIIQELRGRKGFAHLWEGFDEDIQMEIIHEWQLIVDKAIKKDIDDKLQTLG